MSNIADAIDDLKEIVENVSLPSGNTFHYEPSTLGDDNLGSADHRAFEIIPTRTNISRDEGQGRGHIQTALEIPIKWRIQFYEARDIYKNVSDELVEIERAISYAAVSNGIMAYLVEGWTIDKPDDPEVLSATMNVLVLTDEE